MEELFKKLAELISYDDLLNIYKNDKEFIEKEMEKLIKNINDGCEDNFRVARLDDEIFMGMYEAKEANGCCGSVDEIIETPNGVKYKIGFNYGH